MDPPAGGSGAEPSSDQPDSSQPEASRGDDARQVDAWCAISSSPRRHPESSSGASLANAPATVPDTNLWQVGGSSSSTMDEAAAAVAGVPWCTDDEHGHQPHDPSFLDSSTSGVPRFPADSCNIDLGAEYRHGPFPGTLGREESLELLADTWAQLAPDELERYSQDELRHFQDDLEQFLYDADLPVPPVNPETPNDESETMSSSVSVGDTPDEAVVTSSGESPGGAAAAAAPSAGVLKRKGPALDDIEGGAPSGESPQQQQHQQSMDTLQKKLKGPVAAAERPSLPRTSRPRYAIQTRTEVDVIDDGYRWRKYGQKPVKNSAHPRNYYRCTTANCPVRKRVERSTENPSHVLTTYDGTHTHPETASTGSSHASRDVNPPGNVPSGNTEDVPLPAPVSPQQPAASLGPMPPRLPPSNYITPNIIGHLLAAGSQVPPDQSRRWSHPPPQAGGTFFQRNIDLLRAHQLFRLQYGTQYPLLSNMLNLMRNFSRVRPPLLDPRMDPRLDPRLDPRTSLFAAQSYNAMRLGTGGQIHPDPNLGSAGAAALDSQQQGQQQQQSNLTSPSATSSASPGATSSPGPSAGPNVGPSIGPISMAQRLLWLQELMGEGLVSEARHSSQQPAPDNSGGAEKEGPENNNPDVGDPPA